MAIRGSVGVVVAEERRRGNEGRMGESSRGVAGDVGMLVVVLFGTDPIFSAQCRYDFSP